MKLTHLNLRLLFVNLLSFMIMLLGTSFVYGQTTIGGVLGTSTLTEAESPYHVTTNIYIPEDVIVTVEPGVTLEFNSNISMLIHGSFRAIGTVTDSIFFKPHATATAGWGAIKWEDAADDYGPGVGNILSYVSYYGTSSIPPYLWIKDCKVRIQNSRFHDCPKQFSCSGNAQVYDCLFHNMDAVAIAGGRNSDGEPAEIIGNEFYNINDDYSAIYINGGKFIDNYVHDISTPDRVVQVGTNSFIGKNRIENCNSIGIFTSYYHSGSEIYCNTVKNNLVNLYLHCKTDAIISNNNFLDPIDFNVVLRGTDGPDPYIGHQVAHCDDMPAPGSYDLVDLQGNYWGDLSPSELEESFYDFEEDFNIGLKVDFSSPAPTDDCRTGSLAIPENNQLTFNIYPNPSNSILNLEMETEIQRVYIYDQLGNSIMEFTDDSKVLNISDLPVGVYYLSIIAQDGIGVQKFVKN